MRFGKRKDCGRICGIELFRFTRLYSYKKKKIHQRAKEVPSRRIFILYIAILAGGHEVHKDLKCLFFYLSNNSINKITGFYIA